MPLPFIPLPNGAQIVIKGTLFGQVTEEIHWIVFDTSPGASDIQGAAEDYDTWFRGNVLGFLSEDYSYVSTTCNGWSSPSDPTFTVAPPSPLHGGRETPSVPNTVAVVISWKTALRGKSFRGRTYLAGITAVACSDPNTLGSSGVAEVDAAYVEIPGFGGTGPYDLVVASFVNSLANPTPPHHRTTGVGTPVNAAIVEATLGNQRRRRPGRGI